MVHRQLGTRGIRRDGARSISVTSQTSVRRFRRESDNFTRHRVKVASTRASVAFDHFRKSALAARLARRSFARRYININNYNIVISETMRDTATPEHRGLVMRARRAIRISASRLLDPCYTYSIVFPSIFDSAPMTFYEREVNIFNMESENCIDYRLYKLDRSKSRK